jgi:holo-[acyl-carrier protein] synthase
MQADLCVHVGTDVESVAEVAASLDRWGQRYTRRLFTDNELADCGVTPSAAERLTARFAAKEAVIKLLAPGDAVPGWRSIEVCVAPNGAPSVVLHAEAADLARERGMSQLSVSLSHAAGIGTATVVALATPERG